MAIFKERLPTKQDIGLVFAGCVVAVYTWSILIFFRRLPGLLLYLRIADLIGVLAYTQIFALLESAGLLLFIVLLCILLPARFFRHKFVVYGSSIVFISALYAAAIQIKPDILLHSKAAPFGLVLYLVLNGVAYGVLRRYTKVQQIVNTLVERLTALMYIYMTTTVISIIIVVVRNI